MKDYVSQSRKHFNRQAAEYDNNTSYYYSGPAKISCKDAVEYLSNYEFDTLLDVGCGTGFLIDQLAKIKSTTYYGVDISENMLSVAISKNIKGTNFVEGVADCLPFRSNTFDVVTCIQSFHHYPDSDKAMKEVLRVLKPGGLYFLSDTGIGGIGGWIDNHILFKLLKSGDCHTENRYGIARRMEKNGFSDISHKQIQGFIYTVIGHKAK